MNAASEASADRANAERQVGGLFVWAIEGFLFSLLAWSVFISLQSLDLLPVYSLHEWLLVTITVSSFAHVLVQSITAFSRKSGTLQRGTRNAVLHQGFAQAHCSVVFLVLALYVMVWIEAQNRLQWMQVFFSTTYASSVVFLGVAMLAFSTTMLIVTVCNAFAATVHGVSNWLFLTPSTLLLLGILAPFLHEIGDRELLLCTGMGTNSAAIVLVNSGLLVSYTFFVLDALNFDPLRAFNGSVLQARWDIGLDPKFRLYLFLHALLVLAWLIMYFIFAKTISVALWIVLLSAAALAGVASFGAWPEWRSHADAKNDRLNNREVHAQRDIPTAVVQGGISAQPVRLRIAPNDKTKV